MCGNPTQAQVENEIDSNAQRVSLNLSSGSAAIDFLSTQKHK